MAIPVDVRILYTLGLSSAKELVGYGEALPHRPPQILGTFDISNFLCDTINCTYTPTTSSIAVGMSVSSRRAGQCIFCALRHTSRPLRRRALAPAQSASLSTSPALSRVGTPPSKRKRRDQEERFPYPSRGRDQDEVRLRYHGYMVSISVFTLLIVSITDSIY
jgi:hypothetical protein